MSPSTFPLHTHHPPSTSIRPPSCAMTVHQPELFASTSASTSLSTVPSSAPMEFEDEWTYDSTTGISSRPLHGIERFWNFAQMHLEGVCDMVSLFQVEPVYDDPQRWKRAWMQLRQEFTLLQCRLVPKEQLMVFPGPKDASSTTTSEAEAESSFDIVDLPELHSTRMMDHCLNTYAFDRFHFAYFCSPTPSTTASWIGISNGHSLADALTAICFTRRLGVIATTLDDGSLYNGSIRRPLPPSLAATANVKHIGPGPKLTDMFKVAVRGVSAFLRLQA